MAEIRPLIQLANDPRERHRAIGLIGCGEVIFVDSPVSA
jgi:hypothetical protein